MTAQTVTDMFFLGFIGACIGSFLGVVIERVPSRQSLMGRSHCVCGRQLPWYENIPMFSFLALRARARCCGASIPSWYFWVEVLTAAMGVAAVVVAGSLLGAVIGATAGWLVFGGIIAASAVQNRRNSPQR